MKRADCKVSTPSFSLDSYAYRSDGQEPSRYKQIQKVVERYCVYIHVVNNMKDTKCWIQPSFLRVFSFTLYDARSLGTVNIT